VVNAEAQHSLLHIRKAADKQCSLVSNYACYDYKLSA
jgi:hypothetical protein